LTEISFDCLVFELDTYNNYNNHGLWKISIDNNVQIPGNFHGG